MKKTSVLFLLIVSCFFELQAQNDLSKILKQEIDRNFAVLKNQEVPAYYMCYRIHDTNEYSIEASFGNINKSSEKKDRLFSGIVRVGDEKFDNYHNVKGIYDESSNYIGTVMFVMDNNKQAIQTALWDKTDQLYKDAVKQYDRVKGNKAVKVSSEDKSDDFSKEKSQVWIDKKMSFEQLKPDIKKWEEKIASYSNVFTENKDLITGRSDFSLELVRKYFVDTDGNLIEENAYGYRLTFGASTRSADGMDIPLYKSYFEYDINKLPSDKEIIAEAQEMSKMLSLLKKAPEAESYTGPALLSPFAASVFFHEIFGHRIEGARLKQDSDAQTFKKKIGEQVLPESFSVIFDPQPKTYKGFTLAGSYNFDDEGMKGQKVNVVENGILKSFLMSRTPIEGFSNSNGHGRAMIYYSPVTRQSNMFVEIKDKKTDKELRRMLIDEAKKQNKEYGYLFDRVSGGFTFTGRYMPNSFNVTPLVVYKIYVDGRPDELVRGVNLVGTPLSMFAQITAGGADDNIFNGYCGAESGSIPVSAISPTLFVKVVETQKKGKSQDQFPLLERP